jgi:hypothetical protein
MTEIKIKVLGIDKIQANFARFQQEFQAAFRGAGDEVANEILNTEGLRKYPPATSANQPPTPYYIRGRGTQYASRNNGKSERYGTQFYTEPLQYGVEIGNRASYAQWLAGENQASRMGAIGWRKLHEVAQEKVGEITRIFQSWIERALKRTGLS